MRSSRLYAAKWNSMPKLEFAISESPEQPGASRCQLAHLSPPVLRPPSFLIPIRLSSVSIANTKSWFRSWCILRSRHTVDFAAKFPPRSAKWIREREWIAGYRAEDLSLFTSCFFFSQLANLRETEADWRRSVAPRRTGYPHRPVAGEVA